MNTALMGGSRAAVQNSETRRNRTTATLKGFRVSLVLSFRKGHIFFFQFEESMTKSSTLLLVRHGERADDEEIEHPWKRNRGSRPEDCPLTDLGRKQAVAVGRRLASEALPCEVVYTSPMRRCLETATEIAHQMNLPVSVIVPLGKSCSYFERCTLQGQKPVYANRSEVTDILKSIQPTVPLHQYYEDDGTGCITTIQRLVTESNEGKPQKQSITLIVGHCESQREIARLSGRSGRIKTPFCGKATFLLQRDERTDGSWFLLQVPEEGELHIPSVSSTLT